MMRGGPRTPLGRAIARTGAIRAAVALGLAAAALAGLPAASSADGLRAGAARSDITPDLGRPAGGYVRPDISIDGVASRLYARAVVLRRGAQRVALVVVDLQGVPGSLQRDVAARLRPRGFKRADVIVSATHTHSGPGDRIGGEPPIDERGAFLAERIALAVERADRSLGPAAAGWGRAPRADASKNRSLEAYLANQGLDIPPHEGSLHQVEGGRLRTIDPETRVLRVDRISGDGRREPLAVWSQFSAHSTTFTPYNHLYAADYPGVAARRLEARLGHGRRAPMVALANGNEGDQSPRYAGFNAPAAADEEGRRIAVALERGWRRARPSRDLSLAGRHTVFCFCGQRTAGGRVDSNAWMGASFFGGAEDGPSIFYDTGTEGRRLPAEAADPVQGRKVKVLQRGSEGKFPAQVRRVGPYALATVPGEASVEMGRRIRAAVARASGVGSKQVVLTGLTDDYLGYFTTPEEYDQQHYEGGFTPYGKFQSNLMREVLADLARRLRRARSNPEPAARLEPPAKRPSEIDQGDGGAPGKLVGEPPEVARRMNVLDVSWTGGPNGLDRPLDRPFIELQRLGAGPGKRSRPRPIRRPSRHRAVRADSDLGLNFLWRFQSPGNRYTARYDVPPDLRPGAYRFRVSSRRYELSTRRFDVRPSNRLIVRGARARGRRIAFFAQNPAPDPERNIRIRRPEPTGGVLRFRYEGESQRARYRRGAWRATLPQRAKGEVTVPRHGLRDGLGNRSGARSRLRIGHVEPVRFPPPIPIAGGPVPGPAGVGTFLPNTPPGPPPDPAPGSGTAPKTSASQARMQDEYVAAANDPDYLNHAGGNRLPWPLMPLVPPGSDLSRITGEERSSEDMLRELLEP